MEENLEKLNLNSKQLMLLIVTIGISLFSLVTILEQRENILYKNKEETNNINGLIIVVSTLITIYFYWEISYQTYNEVKSNPSSSEETIKKTELNLFARTLFLIAVAIDLFLVIDEL